MLLLYFLFWTAVAANKQLYGKMGDEAVLTPDSVENPITSIEWKHGPDLAIDWYGDETTAYRHFKVRGSLNTLTGALTIRGLTPDDGGIYTVEINNKVTSKTELLVISPVSKPTLSLWCDPEMTYCVLTCNGDTTGAERVTWTSSANTWPLTNIQHNITEEDDELWFSCEFKNPVSSSSSEIVFNPFKKKTLHVEIGEEAALTADSEDSVIASIVWKRGPDAAMKWNGSEIFSHQQFKDRGSLDTLTGDLTITGLTPDDSGNYTVEINNKLTSKTELLVISPVPKPTLSEWCSMTYCVLTCNGDTTRAEPVTYGWSLGDTALSSTKEITITMIEKELWLSWFSCTFENPLGSNSSEKVFNPFLRNQIIAIAVLFLVFCIVMGTFKLKGIIHFSHIRKTWVLKWTGIYTLVCVLLVFNIILFLDMNLEGREGAMMTMMFILMAVFAVILVGGIVGFVFLYSKFKAANPYFSSYFAAQLKKMSILIPVLFLDIFNIIINLIFEGSRDDLTVMIIIIAVVGVILVGLIIFFIYFMKKLKLALAALALDTYERTLRQFYRIFDLIFMVPCISGLFNIIILMYRAINGALIWLIILTAIFGVILVGFIITIIYLIYKDTKFELRAMLTFIAVCVPVVFNIINSLYRAIIGGVTWMIIVTAIFGVILVGGIIFFIRLMNKLKRQIKHLTEFGRRLKQWALTFKFMLTAVCISGVCNIIINFVFRGGRVDLTWMFNFLPLCILVGFIIIFIYLTIFFRRKRRQRAAEGRWDEFLKDWAEERQSLKEAFLEWLKEGETADETRQTYLKRWAEEYLEWLNKDTDRWRRRALEARTRKGASERIWQEFQERFNKGAADEREWQEFLKKWDKEYQKMLNKGNTAERIWKVFLQRLARGDAEKKWQEMLKRLRKAFLQRLAKGEDEKKEQERLERLDEGEDAEKKWKEYQERLRNGPAESARQEFLQRLAKGPAEKKWQEFLENWDKEYQEWKKKGEAAEDEWKDMLERLNKEYQERSRYGAAESAKKEFLERLRKGPAEKKWKVFLENWDKEYQEWKKKGEAAEDEWKDMLERLRKAFLQRLAEGDSDESEEQDDLEEDYEGDYDHEEWQEYLEKKRKGAAERARKAFLKRRDKVNSKISEINKTSTQDLETAESPDPSNETESPAGPGSVEETSNQDTTSTGPPETSKEPEESTTSPDVTETSTQDLETAESSDPSNKTETTEMPPSVQNTSTQDLTSVVVQDPSNETVNSTIPEVHKTSTQDLKTAESPDTSNETERPAGPGSVEETSNQDATSTGSPETSNEPEMLEMRPLKNPFTQDPTSVVVQVPSNETAKIPDVPETCRLLMDEQTADPEDEAQS